MDKLLSSFSADESGATAVEYGVIALVIGIGIVGSLQGIPSALDNIFGNVSANLTN